MFWSITRYGVSTFTGYGIIIIRSSRLKKELQEIMADSIYEEMEKAPNETIISITSNDITIELSKEFLVKLQKNTYHGSLNEDVVEHIAKVLEMVELIYAPDGKITTWEGLVEKFFCRFYPESYDGEDEMLDEGEDWGIDPLEFLSNINTYVNNIISNNDESKYENPPNTGTDSFFKAYDMCDIEEEIRQGQMKRKNDDSNNKKPSKKMRTQYLGKRRRLHIQDLPRNFSKEGRWAKGLRTQNSEEAEDKSNLKTFSVNKSASRETTWNVI
ncbi:hypothetical protein Tco_1063598 [Tanacetum coccineum]